MARLSFRQGIVKDYQGGDSFLTTNGNFISLVASKNENVQVTLVHGPKDYLYTETSTVPQAWGPFAGTAARWLYWDINKATGVRTFGSTDKEPIESASAPSSPAPGQMWFDTTSNQWKEWSGSSWVIVLRVFAAKLSNGSTFDSMSINATSGDFKGTQVGLTSNTRAGALVFDTSGNPIFDANKRFFTTEDNFLTGVPTGSRLRISNIIKTAIADENIPSYGVVSLNGVNQVRLATVADQGQKVLGVVDNSASKGDLVDFVTEGIFFNSNWDWFTAGLSVNDPVYIDNNGTITKNSQSSDQLPIGVVMDAQTIMFAPRLFPQIQGGGAGAVSMDELSDAAIINPANNQILSFNENSGNWENITPNFASTVDQLNDVQIDSISNEQILFYEQRGGGTPPLVWQQSTDDVYALAVDSTDNVYVGEYNGTLTKFDPQGNTAWTFTGHTGSVVAGLGVDDDNYVYSGSWDGTVRKIDPSGNQVWSLQTGNSYVEAIDVLPDGSYIYSGEGGSPALRKIDSTGSTIWTFTGNTNEVYSVAVNSSQTYIYTNSFDSTVRKIDQSGNQVWQFTGHASGYSIAVDSNDYTYAGFGGSPYLVKIDPAGTKVWEFTGHNDTVFGVDVDVNDNVYTASWDYTFKKIDPSGTELWTYATNDYAYTIKVTDSTNYVYAGGTSYVFKLEQIPIETAWFNVTPQLDTLTDVNATSPVNGNILTWNDNNSEWKNTGFQLTGYDIQNATADGITFDLSNQLSQPQGITSDANGNKLYVIGNSDNIIYEYTVSTPWDLSTISYNNVSLDASAETTSPESIFMGDSGNMLFITDAYNVYAYTLSTPYDLSTASYSSVSFSAAGQLNTFTNASVTFNNDGTKMFLADTGNGNEFIYQYTLSTPWDISTATYDSVSLDVSAQGSVDNFAFNANGDKLFAVVGITTEMFQYSLSTPFDLSTASYNNVFTSIDARAGFVFKPDGTKLFAVDSGDDLVQYSTIGKSSPADGQTLVWNTANGGWESTTLTLNNNEDVDTTSTVPSTDDTLVWDGSNWVPTSLTQSQVSLTTTTISSNTTLPTGNPEASVYLVSGTTTVTLPNASSYTDRVFYIKNVDTSTVTINTQGENIDGNTSISLSSQHASITVVSNGTNWFNI